MARTADSVAEATGPETSFLDDDAMSMGEALATGRMAASVRERIVELAGEPQDAPVLGPSGSGSGRDHPLALAEAATWLWTRLHKFDAADPGWPDRDRFVLCDGRSEILHRVLMQMSNPANTTAAAAPLAVDTASGPLGQGLGQAVGLALAERLLAARFGRSLVDHRTWVIACDSDLMAGLSHEAASLAGHLRLGRLTVLWDETPRDDASMGFASEGGDTLRRFSGYGWSVRRIDGQSSLEVASALSMAVRSAKPTLIACRGGAIATVSSTNGDQPATARTWAAVGARGSSPRRAWLKRLARHALRAEFERVMAARLPDELTEALDGLRGSFAASRPAMATRAASQSVLEAVVPRLPELVGGSTDLAVPATGHFAAHLQGVAVRTATAGVQGRRVPWAMREHGMAAAMNGIALHGGLIPYGGTFVVFSDYMRPALRLAALMRQRVIHVLTRDGGDRAEDAAEGGPAHQAIEQLASLRAVPNLCVFRPADAIETAECWELALRRDDGPSLLALSRQPVPSLRPPGPAGENRAARGGYVLAEADGGRHATLIATGPEVATAMAARESLRAQGVRVAVVSLPCWELFERLDKAEQDEVLGAAPRIGIEAAGPFGWARWLGPDGVFVGFRGPAANGREVAWAAQIRPTAADVIAAVSQVVARST